MIKKFIKLRLLSFKNAFLGWWHVIRTQQNAWIHTVITLLMLVVGFWLQLSLLEWAILILIIAIVWTAEFLNTALEIVVDLICPELHPLAKAGKDVGAASVLIAAVCALIIGILVLGPPLLDKLSPVFNYFASIF